MGGGMGGMGGMGGSRQRRGPRKGEPVVHPIKATLEQLYCGRTVTLAINRTVQEDKSEQPTPCGTCDGHGVVVRVVQIGPGMIQQMQTACSACRGAGYDVRMKKERATLEVKIEPGMRHGDKIVKASEGDQKAGQLQSDIIFVLQEAKHAVFSRQRAAAGGDHLLVERTVSLKDALCGVCVELEHLDGRTLSLETEPGEVVAPGAMLYLPDEGMPTRGRPSLKGRLVVKFNVVFPDAPLSASVRGGLREKLPAGVGGGETVGAERYTERAGGDDSDAEDTEEGEEYTLEPFRPGMLKEDFEQHRSAYDSDEEEEFQQAGGRGVQCAQA
jgi:DnaJ family protein A protein 2